jgi:hypothetical protein
MSDFVTFYIAPVDPSTINDPIERMLLDEHQKECERRGGEFTNFGALQGNTEFFSKTTKGKLFSEIDPVTKKVSHFWEDYGDAP